jgi:hypothetical protein
MFGDNIKDGVGMIPGVGESFKNGISFVEDLGKDISRGVHAHRKGEHE